MALTTIRKAIGQMKDQTSICIAKMAGNIALKVLVVKATSHDEDPADEKLRKTHDWIVALKSLLLVHKLLVNENPCFEEDIVHATRRGMMVLNMSDFRDDVHSNLWDHVSFVRFYAMYLEEKVEFLAFKKKRNGGEGKFEERDERIRHEYGEFRDDYDREMDRRPSSYGDLNDFVRREQKEHEERGDTDEGNEARKSFWKAKSAVEDS
ncbi:hypothetical protein CRYUN_Cryun03dG0071800 [Craigia yunnanensis]